MEQLLARFHELKELKQEIEQELEALRQQILAAHPEAGTVDAGAYRLAVRFQERREYDDERLYKALPDPALWRLMSKADAGKISSLLKMQIIHDGILDGTYEVRRIPILQVKKQ